MLWLGEKGFDCTGLERSMKLAALAGEHSGRPVIAADFETFDFSRMEMDGVLLIGALVHIPHERFPLVLSDIRLSDSSIHRFSDLPTYRLTD